MSRSCMATLAMLRAGVRDHHALGMVRTIDGLTWAPARELFARYG